MDIISHTLTGVAVGTVFATLFNGNWKKKSAIILVGGLGGALPDFDALSLWSKFDTTIGSFLGLTHTGNEIYFGKFWYSHHAAFHSILAPIILSLLMILLITIKRRDFKLNEVLTYIIQNKYSYFAFVFGFTFHLLEDMPTPASVWGGVNLFFPSSGYIGGFGNIWWWNNYDLVLIITSVIILNLLVNLLPKIQYQVKSKISIGVFVLGLTLGIYQIKTRPVDFSYTGFSVNYQKMEAQSKEIQCEILGDKWYQIMESIDNKIPLNF